MVRVATKTNRLCCQSKNHIQIAFSFFVVRVVRVKIILNTLPNTINRYIGTFCAVV